MSTSRSLVLVLGALLFAGMSTITGCSTRLNEEDLGEIQTVPGQLPGAGEKYALPEPYFSSEEHPSQHNADDVQQGSTSGQSDSSGRN
jgi:hypothetical protein